MGLSGLDIYKRLPKTNCKKCGFPTCLAFSMQLAAKKVSLSQCADVSEEAKKYLEESAEPPVKMVTIGKDESQLAIGNETVLFRHEETFYRPTLIGIEVSDKLSEKDLTEKISAINNLKFERIGKTIAVNLIALVNESTKEDFEKALSLVMRNSKLNLVLIVKDPGVLGNVTGHLKDRRPLLYGATKETLEKFVDVAKTNNVPLVLSGNSLEELNELVQKSKNLGFNDIILDVREPNLKKKIWDFTQVRRLALKKNFRNLGFPILARISATSSLEQLVEASTLVLKYAGLVILKDYSKEVILPLLTAREDLYTDPQKPVQVEAKVYEIGNVSDKSPVIITTNFSITYFTVAGEVETSKVPTYILSVDSEGMSVLTAWAAEKFTPERINKAIQESNIMSRVAHKQVIIPGYVSMMSGKLEEESGLEIVVGPREASGLPTFLKNIK